MKFQVGDRVFVHSHCYFEDNYNAEGDGFRYSNSKNVTYICIEKTIILVIKLKKMTGNGIGTIGCL